MVSHRQVERWCPDFPVDDYKGGISHVTGAMTTLDAGIADVIVDAWAEGFVTYASCEGSPSAFYFQHEDGAIEESPAKDAYVMVDYYKLGDFLKWFPLSNHITKVDGDMSDYGYWAPCLWSAVEWETSSTVGNLIVPEGWIEGNWRRANRP